MNRVLKPAHLWMFGWALLGLFGAPLPAPAQTKDAPYEKVVTIEGITEYRFPNGLRFLSFPDPSSANITVNMTVLVGSRHEGYGETGMAHLLEHMLFKGSKQFPHVDKSMQQHGADFNGTTWTDRTNYFETMPATDANLKFGIELEADRLVNSFVKREDLVSEMTVVRNEFEMGENSPERILNQRMMATAFEWHNYGKSTIGNRADIERVPIESLQAFYKKYYQPDNVVLILAGQYDEAKALEHVTRTFGAIKAPSRKLAQTYTEEPAQDGERTVLLRRVGKVPVVGAMYHVPAAAHEDHPALEVLSSVLGDTPSGRLYKALVEGKKATKVSAETTAWHDPGIFEMNAFVADKATPEEVRDLMLEAAESLSARPATKDEVERAVRKYLADRELALTKSKTIALELSEWAAAGDWRLLFIHRDRVAKVTPDDVNRVAGKYLRQSNRTVGMFVPAGESRRTPIPSTPPIETLVKDYRGGKAITAGEAFDPTPEKIEERVKRLVLPGGLKVALFPKKTRGESVVGTLTLHFGNEESLQQNVTASSLVGSLLTRGTKKHTREELRDELDRLKSRLNTASSLGSVSVGLESRRDALPKILDLMREVLREPTFPEKEFDNIKQNQKQALEKASTDPQALAFRELMRQLNPYPKQDVRYQPTIPESLDRLAKVTREDVVRLYQQQVGGAAGELVLVGDFDPDETARQLETIFADWKAQTPYRRVTQTAQTGVKGGRENILTPEKENAVYVTGTVFPMKDTDPDYPAMTVGNHILGTGFTSRLMDRLRQKEGLSYGAGSVVRVDSQDPYAMFLAYAIVNPENIDKVDKGTQEEVAKIVKSGVTEEELIEARRGILEDMKVDRGSDAKLAGMLREGLHLGRTFQYYADLEKKIAGLDVQAVNQALANRLHPERLLVIRAGDFNRPRSDPKTAPTPDSKSTTEPTK